MYSKKITGRTPQPTPPPLKPKTKQNKKDKNKTNLGFRVTDFKISMNKEHTNAMNDVKIIYYSFLILS